MSTPIEPGPATVRFAQRQTRGLILGLSALRAAALATAIATFVVALVLGGMIGAAASTPLAASLVVMAIARWNGSPAIDALPVVAEWSARAAMGQTRYRRRIATPRPAGTMALPGDAAPLRFVCDPVTGAAMVHDPHRSTIAATLTVQHPAYALLAPDDRAGRVTGWSRALAGLAAAGNIAAIQILEATVPDPGHEMRRWWSKHGVGDGGWAAAQYEELMAEAVGSSTHRTTLTIAVDLRRAAREVRDAGRGIVGAAAVLRTAMTSFESSVRASGLGVAGWLAPSELASVVRHAYDPDANQTSRSPGADLAASGPVAIDEHWDHLRHDSGVSSVLWLSEWPRIEVPPHFLHALVFTPGVRRTLSIVARPLGSAEALRQIRREKVEYVTDAEQKARLGQLADLADEQQYADVLTRERALISGHADLTFTGLVVVTAPTPDELASARAAVERAAVQCGCETRLLYGQQAAAFVAAALPLGRGVHR